MQSSLVIHVGAVSLLGNLMSISCDDFTAACSALQTAWQQAAISEGDWRSVSLHTAHSALYLRIVRSADTASDPDKPQTRDIANHAREEALDNDDPEALLLSTRTTTSHRLVITYDIIHSPTYQVPVVYFYITAPPSVLTPSMPLDAVIPALHRPQVHAVSPLGAVSLTDHPLLGLPCWFVHPCRTSEAMAAMLGDRENHPVEYLMMWLGSMGGSVGLSVPVEMAKALNNLLG